MSTIPGRPVWTADGALAQHHSVGTSLAQAGNCSDRVQSSSRFLQLRYPALADTVPGLADDPSGLRGTASTGFSRALAYHPFQTTTQAMRGPAPKLSTPEVPRAQRTVLVPDVTGSGDGSQSPPPSQPRQ